MYSISAQAVCIVCAKFDYMHLTNTATTVYKSEKIILRSLVSTLSNALFGTLISSYTQPLGITASVRTSLFTIFASLGMAPCMFLLGVILGGSVVNIICSKPAVEGPRG